MLARNGSMRSDGWSGRATLWLIVTAAVILTTLLVGYTVADAPRNWMTWAVLVFICFVEFALGMIAAEVSSTDSSQPMSSAMGSVVISSAGLFGVVGFATIAISLAFTTQTHKRDAVVVSILVVETVAFLIGMALLRNTDRAVQASERASVDSDRVLLNKSARIREVAHSLRALKPIGVDQSLEIESLVKNLETCASQFSHAHYIPPEVEDTLNAAVSGLEAAGAAVARDGLSQTSFEGLTEIERDLQSCARQMAAL